MNCVLSTAQRRQASAFAIRLIAALIASMIVAPATAAADESEVGAKTIVVKCKICDGAGKLVLRPPDHGQYIGAIEPKSHWDVRLACPFCGGKGKRKVYRTSMQPVKDGTPPCMSCGWTGVEKCRACSSSGAVRCNARDCRNGWNVSKVPLTNSSRSYSAKKKTLVTPCPECKGIGKVPCSSCDGMRATLCRKCNGLGRGKEK